MMAGTTRTSKQALLACEVSCRARRGFAVARGRSQSAYLSEILATTRPPLFAPVTVSVTIKLGSRACLITSSTSRALDLLQPKNKSSRMLR